MKAIKKIGLFVFLVALAIFTTLPFLGKFNLSQDAMLETLSGKDSLYLTERLSNEVVGNEYNSSFAFSSATLKVFTEENDKFKAAEDWDKYHGDEPGKFGFKLAKAASAGPVKQNPWLFFFLTFGLGIIGALMYILPDVILRGPPGIKNDGIYHSTAVNRGWIGILTFFYLAGFYALLYFKPYMIVNLTDMMDPLKSMFVEGDHASQWFLYAFMYVVVMSVMATRMFIKYRHNRYQIIRTCSVLVFQIMFGFLIAEILPAMSLPSVDFKNAWPLDYQFLYAYKVKELMAAGMFGKFIFIWGVILALIIVPIMTYFVGKRWYCSWVCGCGGLAETAGDSYRHLSNKKMWTWKLERWLIHSVLIFAVLMTIITGYHTYMEINYPDDKGGYMLFGFSAFNVRSMYGFLIGSIFSGVIGTGFYPILGSRSWCRFGCPLAAAMGIIQRFKSRFRITTNGGQCISCGNCSTYCEQGIDVRAYAQKGQNIVRSSCVGCGVCSAVCPRGVLKLENGPEEGRFGNEGPIVLGNDGFEIKA